MRSVTSKCPRTTSASGCRTSGRRSAYATMPASTRSRICAGRAWPMSFFFQAEDGIRDLTVTGVQTCALPIWRQWNHDSPSDILEERIGSAVAIPRLVEEREVLRMAAQEINALPALYRLPFKLKIGRASCRERV